MAVINALQIIEEAGTVVVEITMAEGELQSGTDVPLEGVQVGTATVNGKAGTPFFLNGTLSVNRQAGLSA